MIESADALIAFILISSVLLYMFVIEANMPDVEAAVGLKECSKKLLNYTYSLPVIIARPSEVGMEVKLHIPPYLDSPPIDLLRVNGTFNWSVDLRCGEG
jgi:hypothetical protein